MNTGAFEPVNQQNRQELTNLIDQQQGLMEGHKGILKIALDMFNPNLGYEAIPADTEHLMRGIIIKSHQYIINSNNKDIPRINQARADLRQWTQNPPPISLQSSRPVIVPAYSEFHAPYGEESNVGGARHIPVAEPVGQSSSFQGQQALAGLDTAVAARHASPYAHTASPPPPSSLWSGMIVAAAYPVGSHIPEASVDPRAAQGQAQGAQGRGQGGTQAPGQGQGAQGRGHGAAPGRGNPGRRWW